MTASDLMPQFLLPVLQITAILCATSLCGYTLQQLRQPRVVGEIAGGLLLGPLAAFEGGQACASRYSWRASRA